MLHNIKHQIKRLLAIMTHIQYTTSNKLLLIANKLWTNLDCDWPNQLVFVCPSSSENNNI